jgi:hypothetical protein
MKINYKKQADLTRVSASKWKANEPGSPEARSSLVTAALAAALTVQAVFALACPSDALARPSLTPDERVTIDVYKKSKPSVVNIANMTTRYGSKPVHTQN